MFAYSKPLTSLISLGEWDLERLRRQNESPTSAQWAGLTLPSTLYTNLRIPLDAKKQISI